MSPQNLISDILRGIFKYLGESDLYHSALVNRHWCRDAVPLLWQNAFPDGYWAKVLPLFLSLLDVKDRTTLTRCGIALGPIPKTEFFNYPAFLKQICCKDLATAINNWCEKSDGRMEGNDNPNVMVARALFNLLLSRNTKLVTLVISPMERSCEYLCFILAELKYRPLLEPIKELTVGVPHWQLCSALSLSCKNVETMHLKMDDVPEIYVTSSVMKSLGILIAAQAKLSCLRVSSIRVFSKYVVKALASQACHIRHLEFCDVRFCEAGPFNGLAACSKLEVIRLIRCDHIDRNMVAPLKNAKFPNLQMILIEWRKRDLLSSQLLEWARATGKLITARC